MEVSLETGWLEDISRMKTLDHAAGTLLGAILFLHDEPRLST